MNRLIILSTQICGNSYRLSRTISDFEWIHNLGRCDSVIFRLPNIEDIQLTAINNYNAYPNGGAISNRSISDWIIAQNYGHNHLIDPTRLLFRIEVNGTSHIYSFIGKLTDVNSSYL